MDGVELEIAMLVSDALNQRIRELREQLEYLENYARDVSMIIFDELSCD